MPYTLTNFISVKEMFSNSFPEINNVTLESIKKYFSLYAGILVRQSRKERLKFCFLL